MKFKLFGTEIYISFLFAAVITAMLCFDKTGLILPIIFAVTMHEAGHLFTMWILGAAPRRIRLVPAAVEIDSVPFKKPRNENAVAVSGPAVNIILFAALYINYLLFKKEASLVFGLVNLLIGCFNLLPFTGLDGGTLLFNLLCRSIKAEKSVLVMRIINLSAAAVLTVTGVTLCFKGHINISLFTAVLYLIVMALIKI